MSDREELIKELVKRYDSLVSMSSQPNVEEALMADLVRNWRQVYAALRSHQEMKEALEPFAAIAEKDISESEADDDQYWPMSRRYAKAGLLTVGDLRRARTTLATLEKE